MTEVTMGRPVEILLVEDSPSDAFLAQKAFSSFRLLNKVHIVDNGVDAIAFVRREGPYAESPRPDLVLLDLNLPRKDGKEVLQEIKCDDDLKSIPVVILTSSKEEEDVLRSYQLHANCYITKPVDFQRLSEAVKSIGEFWFCLVTVPNSPTRNPP